MSKTVQIRAGTKRQEGRPKYHTTDCHRIAGVETREVDLDTIPQYDECKICANGHVKQKSQATEPLAALKNTDPDEI